MMLVLAGLIDVKIFILKKLVLANILLVKSYVHEVLIPPH